MQNRRLVLTQQFRCQSVEQRGFCLRRFGHPDLQRLVSRIRRLNAYAGRGTGGLLVGTRGQLVTWRKEDAAANDLGRPSSGVVEGSKLDPISSFSCERLTLR